MQGRVLVPNYVEKYEYDDRESTGYSPWIIMIPNDSELGLTNEAIDKHYEDFKASEYYDEDFSEFIAYLEQLGYEIVSVEEPGIWSPGDPEKKIVEDV
jgi:hypothetical protein